MSRLNQLNGRFDAVIVGGGIIGAGIARDAALRGLKVAVLDRADFGGATTAASTRLIHGGLRYLQTLDIRLVRLDLRERETLLRIAPHLVKPLPFFLPFYDATILNRLTLRAGMTLYDALSYDKSLPPHRILNAREAAALEPALRPEGLSGGALYYDAQVSSPERLTLENILEARELGAVALNYADVSGAFRQDGQIGGVEVTDRLTGERARIHGRVVINASGPWFDRVAATLSPHPKPEVRTTKGIHVACHALIRQAVLLYSKIDGRAFFAIPWAGHTWIGTTDTDYAEDPAVATATADDVRYLLQSARDYIPAIDAAQAYWTCAGIRALVKRGGPASATSRLHRIRETVPGLISIVGGKITGYRQIAEEATSHVCARLRIDRRCETSDRPLPGARSAFTGDSLGSIYGARAERVIALTREDPQLAQPLASQYPDIAAQVVLAVREE